MADIRLDYGGYWRLMSATTVVGNNRRPDEPLLAFIRRKDEKRGFCGAADQVTWRHVEAGSYPIDGAKAGTLDSTLQIADEGAIKASPLVELHLRKSKIFARGPHYFAKRSFHASTRLNLLSTLGHLEEHPERLSAVGQRVTTDNCRSIERSGGPL
jgi:hypothetical protein